MTPQRPSEQELSDDLARVLAEGTHQFIFIDDGGAGHHNFAPEILVQDHLTYTGVIVPPGQLWSLHDEHADWLADAQADAPGVHELHATAVVNPTKSDPWRRVSDVRCRARHLRRAAELLLPYVEIVIHGHIGQEQYEALLHQHAAEVREFHDHAQRSLRTHARGLETMFQAVIGSAVQQTRIPTVVVQDEGRHRQRSKHQYDPRIPIWQGAVIYHPSHAWPGLQVADLASFVLSRMYCIADKRRRGKSRNIFDDVCSEIACSLESRLVDAWKL